MPLELEQRDVEGLVILNLSGRIVAGPDAADLRRTFEHLVSQKKNRIILDLKEVEYIDSTGLGMLVMGHSLAEEAGGTVKLLNISKRSAQLLVLTKLSTVFQIFDDEQAAVNSFFPEREIRRFDVLEFVKSQEAEREKIGSDGPESKPEKKP